VDPRTFYWIFIILFTILAFVTGSIVASIAMSARDEPTEEQPHGAQH
jgi:hypothetical protein